MSLINTFIKERCSPIILFTGFEAPLVTFHLLDYTTIRNPIEGEGSKLQSFLFFAS